MTGKLCRGEIRMHILYNNMYIENIIYIVLHTYICIYIYIYILYNIDNHIECIFSLSLYIYILFWQGSADRE